jgi:hypothetical protein
VKCQVMRFWMRVHICVGTRDSDCKEGGRGGDGTWKAIFETIYRPKAKIETTGIRHWFPPWLLITLNPSSCKPGRVRIMLL